MYECGLGHCVPCQKNQFHCGGSWSIKGSCVNNNQKCNSDNDCGNWNDEPDGCKFPASLPITLISKNECTQKLKLQLHGWQFPVYYNLQKSGNNCNNRNYGCKFPASLHITFENKRCCQTNLVQWKNETLLIFSCFFLDNDLKKEIETKKD